MMFIIFSLIQIRADLVLIEHVIQGTGCTSASLNAEFTNPSLTQFTASTWTGQVLSTCTSISPIGLASSPTCLNYIASIGNSITRTFVYPSTTLLYGYKQYKLLFTVLFLTTSTDLIVTLDTITVYTHTFSQISPQFQCSSNLELQQQVEVILNYETINLSKLKLTVSGSFAIRDFMIFGYSCGKNCLKCDLNPNQNNACTLCIDPFMDKNQCQACPIYQIETPAITCVNTCPIPYYPDIYNWKQCVSVISSSLVYSDLINATFTQAQFQLIADPFNNIGNFYPYITQINSQSIAGPFIANQGIQFLMDITAPQIFVKFTFYIMGQFIQNSNFQVLINQKQISRIVFNDFNNQFGIYPIKTNTNVCGNNCYSYSYEFPANITGNLTNISFIGHFSAIDQTSTWGLRDLYIQKISYYPPATPIGTKILNGQIVQSCPYYTKDVSNTCIDYGTQFSTFKYLVKLFYDLNFHSGLFGIVYINQQIEPITSFQYYQNRLIQVLRPEGLTPYLIINIDIPENVYSITIAFTLLFIDPNPIPTVTYRFGSLASGTVILDPTLQLSQNLGQGQQDYYQKVNITIPYFINDKNQVFTITCDLKTDAQCGIMDLFIISGICFGSCKQCTGPLASDCLTTIYSCSVAQFVNREFSCQPCLQACQTCSSFQTCDSCPSSHDLVNGQCICRFSQTDVPMNRCYPQNSQCPINCLVCQDYQSCLMCDSTKNYQLSVNTCICISGYYQKQTSCAKCAPSCATCRQNALYCTSCFATQYRQHQYQSCECLPGYFEFNSNVYCQQCDNLCQNCALTKTTCTSCYPSQNRTLFNTSCICQDGYYDNQQLVCQQCSYACKTCSDFNTCLSCQINRVLSQTNQCVCQATYVEINQVCQLCDKTCLLCSGIAANQCTFCNSTRQRSALTLSFSCNCKQGYYDNGTADCISCQTYINPSVTNYCYTSCGDGIVQWNEDCDSNDRSCVNCHFTSSPCASTSCLSCFTSQCQSCSSGYYLINYECQPCSNICQTCSNSASNCGTCTITNPDGTCNQCTPERGYMIVNNNTCVSVCGDGIRTSDEECDDDNMMNGDGCNNKCQVEPGWICQVTCQRLVYPTLTLYEYSSDSIYKAQRTVQIQCNQPLVLSGQLLNQITFSIQNCSNCNITSIDMSNYQTNYIFLKITLQIVLFDSDNNVLQIHINNKSFANSQGNSFQQNYTMSLLSYHQPSQTQITATTSLISFNQYLLYFLLGLVILAFLFGGLDIFWNLLDTIQLLSYLQFFNVQLPYNLSQYYTLFQFAQFNFIQQYFNIQDIIQNYAQAPDPDPKFLEQGYPSLFIVNVISVIAIFLMTLGTYLICRFALFVIEILMLKISSAEKFEENQILYFIYKWTAEINTMLYQFVRQIQSIFIRTYMATTYDLNIAIFLQLRYYQLNNGLIVFSQLLNFGCIIYQSLQLVQFYNKINIEPYVYKLSSMEAEYGALYEGIRLQQYSRFYNIFLLLKKISFMFVLVFLYDTPCFQIGFASLLSLTFIIYIIFIKPIKDMNEFIKVVFCEGTIWISEILLFCFALNESHDVISDTAQQNIGWVIIALYTFLIFVQLIIDMRQHGLYLFKKYRILSQLLAKFSDYINRRNYDHGILRQIVVKSNSEQKLRTRKLVTFTLNFNTSQS